VFDIPTARLPEYAAIALQTQWIAHLSASSEKRGMRADLGRIAHLKVE
jgi:hypothetical protein